MFGNIVGHIFLYKNAAYDYDNFFRMFEKNCETVKFEDE